MGACVEHSGGQYLAGGLYTGNFLNAGVTFWDVAASQELRQRIVERGRCRFRSLIDDQLALNELIHTQYCDRLTILPTQYNFRACLRMRVRGWPTVQHLDGVRIYHNSLGIETAKQLMPFNPKADLPPLKPDPGPLGPGRQFWRRLQQRLWSI